MLCATSSFTVPFRLLTVLVCRASTAPALAMSRFPNGRPDNILGSPRRPLPTSHFAVAGAADVDDQAPTYSTDSASEEDHAAASRRAGARAKDPSRRPVNPKDGKVRVPWVEYDIVQGWPAVEAIFKTFSLQCITCCHFFIIEVTEIEGYPQGGVSLLLVNWNYSYK